MCMKSAVPRQESQPFEKNVGKKQPSCMQSQRYGSQ
jgi:hypothetical protein